MGKNTSEIDVSIWLGGFRKTTLGVNELHALSDMRP